MTETQFTPGSAHEIAAKYDEAGFVFPVEVINAEEAQALRDDLEAAEAELADDPERLGLLRAYPDRLLPSMDRLIRNETLVAAASAVLGPDLVVWSSSFFIKEAHSPKIVSWHQDLTYWGFRRRPGNHLLGGAVAGNACQRLHEIRARQPQAAARAACRHIR